MRLPRRYATDDGLPIAYVRVGEGPALLLLHGLGGTADFWQPVIARLAERYTVIAPDLLGFGFSAKPDTLAYTPARHGQAVCAVLRANDINAVEALVGHSCGGVVAITLLASGAVSAARLALAAVPYPSPRFPVRAELLRSPLDRAMLTWRPLAHLFHRLLMLGWPLLSRIGVPPELRGAWVGYMDHTIPSYVGTAEECLFQANLDPLLPALRSTPMLLLYSKSDRTVPFVHGSRLAEQLPQRVLRVVRGDHYAILSSSELLAGWLAADRRP
jgi:pimeloyl-ACP methyl ester carboxylesterase